MNMADKTSSVRSANRPSPDARRAPSQEKYSRAACALAEIIRQTYIEDRSNWETVQRGVAYTYVPNGVDDCGKHTFTDAKCVDQDSLWLRLAVKFIAEAIDPEEYIHTLFECLAGRRKAPEPRNLLDKKNMDVYRQAASRAVDADECRILLSAEKQLAASHISYWQHAGMSFRDAHSFVLLDDNLELSALFRYCLAKQLYAKTGEKIFKKVWQTHKQAACVQFYRNRLQYLVFWEDLLPEGFSELAGKVYEASLTKGWRADENNPQQRQQ